MILLTIVHPRPCCILAKGRHTCCCCEATNLRRGDAWSGVHSGDPRRRGPTRTRRSCTGPRPRRRARCRLGAAGGPTSTGAPAHVPCLGVDFGTGFVE